MNIWLKRLKLAVLSLIPPATVLFVHLFRHSRWPHLIFLDVVAHFAGGFAIAWMAVIFFNGLRKIGDIPEAVPVWLTDYAILGSVFIAGVLWEFMEWGFDTFLGTTTQFTIPETMNDLLMDSLGGALLLAIVIGARVMKRASGLHRDSELP